MPRKVDKYLHDIKEAIDSIENYLGEKRDFSKTRRRNWLKELLNAN